MTTNQWLASAPPAVQVVVRNALQHDAEVKEQLIGQITANANNPYDEDDLRRMTTEQLKPLARLASPRRRPVHNNGNRVTDFFNEVPTANFRGAAAPVNNRQRNDEDEDNTPLVPPTVNWAENAKEIRGSK